MDKTNVTHHVFMAATPTFEMLPPFHPFLRIRYNDLLFSFCDLSEYLLLVRIYACEDGKPRILEI
jgi:hypothetical protein